MRQAPAADYEAAMHAPFRILLVGFFWFLVPGLALAAEPGARQVLDRVERMYRGRSARGRVRIRWGNASGERELFACFWCSANLKTLVRLMDADGRVCGAVLQTKGRTYERLGETREAGRLLLAMLGIWSLGGSSGCALGLAQPSLSGLNPNEAAEPRSVMVLTCAARPPAFGRGGRLEFTVRRRDLLPQQARVYSSGGELRVTLDYTEIRVIGGHKLPSRVRLTSPSEPVRFLEATVEELEFDVPAPPGRVFSVASLSRGLPSDGLQRRGAQPVA